MIAGLTVLLLFQLMGEAIARALLPALPGPVIGLVLMLAAAAASERLAEVVRPVARGILAHLSLLFVPAGVGVVAHLDVLREHGPALLTALVGSTVLAIAAGALAFRAAARLGGGGR